MSRRYAEITYTDSVRSAQRSAGVEEIASRMAAAPVEDTRFGTAERAFIGARDSFYLASVGEGGWPYLQHRGGPRGFLRVLDERTLAFADYRGNMQLLSTGNVTHDDRASLFLMDYPNRRRLKILAHARVVAAADDPELVAQVTDSGASGRVERVFVLTLEAFDWNCPQHITPRFTADELKALSDAGDTALSPLPGNES